MRNTLQPEQITKLKEFRLTTESYESKFSVNLGILLEDRNLSEYLTSLQAKLNAPSKKVSASMFAKRFGFFAVLHLYAMTMLNKELQSTLQDTFIEVDETLGNLWLPSFRIEQLSVNGCLDHERVEWREKVVTSIFAKQISPIISLLSKEANISKLILWENVAIYIFWLYERLLEDPSNEKEKLQIQEDFDYIVKHAPGKLFGSYNRNPISRNFNEKMYIETFKKEVRVRNTCCLYYETTEKGDRCQTCPVTCKFG
ncbi:(2Fe-2S)-binding protein [Bacillus timonensis]|nr:(2Fe-2S)-binding protein [Bacillus timonensis]